MAQDCIRNRLLGFALATSLALGLPEIPLAAAPGGTTMPSADSAAPNWTAAIQATTGQARVCADPTAAAALGSARAEKSRVRRDEPFAHPRLPPDVTLAAVGDVLLHSQLQRQAFADFAGFRSLWRKMEPYLASADIAIANLEGPVAEDIQPNRQKSKTPIRHYDNHVYTGYPLFNYPPAALHALTAAGIDLVSIANNHSYDRGLIGFEATIDALQHNGMAFAGGKADAAPAETPAWGAAVSRDGDKVAFVACSYGFNVRAPDRRHAPLCYEDRTVLLQTIADLSCRRDIAGVVFLPHWGPEYVVRPTRQQRELAYQAMEAGAMAVIGAHPHVVQPVEPYRSEDGRQGAIAFSLGNFASAQVEEPRRTSIVLYLDLARDNAGRLSVGAIRYLPIETLHRDPAGNKRFQVQPIADPDAAAVRYAELVKDGQRLATAHLAQGGGSAWQYAAADNPARDGQSLARSGLAILQDMLRAETMTSTLLAASSEALALQQRQQAAEQQQATLQGQLAALAIAQGQAKQRVTGIRMGLNSPAPQRQPPSSALANQDAQDAQNFPNIAVAGRLVVDADTLFSANSASLRNDAAPLLKSIAETVRGWEHGMDELGREWRVEVQGHADQRPLNSVRYRSNRHLSAERALAVVNALVDAGVDSKRLYASSHGATDPIATDTSDDAYAQNRRVELILRRR